MAMVTASNNPTVLKAVQKVAQIATLPEVTTKIIQLVEDPKSTAKDLQDVIKYDVALSAKILKVVNSAFYGLPRQVGSVDRAIILLGLSTVKNIAVATSMVKLFAGKKISSKFTSKDLWLHSLACGVFCKTISHVRGAEGADEIFVAGLMHDLGLLVEKQIYPDKLASVIDEVTTEKKNICDVEKSVFDADHQEFGSALSGKWKFPHIFQLATGYHHQPFKASKQHIEITATVHLADILAYKKQIGLHFENVKFETKVLDVLELTDQQLADIYDSFEERFQAAESVMK